MLIDDEFAQQMRGDGEQKMSEHMWAMHLCVARSSKTRTLKIRCKQKEKDP